MCPPFKILVKTIEKENSKDFFCMIKYIQISEFTTKVKQIFYAINVTYTDLHRKYDYIIYVFLLTYIYLKFRVLTF